MKWKKYAKAAKFGIRVVNRGRLIVDIYAPPNCGFVTEYGVYETAWQYWRNLPNVVVVPRI